MSGEHLPTVCEQTPDWLLREMRGPEGGFYSALDADSEGEEGRFYVWVADELRALLDDDADEAIGWFGATERETSRGETSRPGRRRAAAARRLAPPALRGASQRVYCGLDHKR